MLLRRDAAQATLDHFLGRPFVWGSVDCARMAAFNLRRLGRKAPLVRFGSYRSALGARKALRSRGFNSLGAVLDDLGLLRVTPASTLPGDLVALGGADLDLSLGVVLGNGRVLGFHELAEGAVVMQPSSYVSAWNALGG